MLKKLTKKELTKVLKSLDAGWELSATGTELIRTLHFKKYFDGFIFLSKLTVHAEVQKMYPTVELKQTSVTVTITASTEKSFTTADMALAKTVDQICALSTTRSKPR